MSIGFEEFIKSVPGNKDVNFDVGVNIVPHADFETLNGPDVIVRRIINILLIKRGTYVFDPEFGEDILQFIFEPADEVTHSGIEQIISNAIEQNKGDEDIGFEVLFFRNKKGFRVNIILTTDGIVKNFPLDVDESLLGEEGQV